MSTPSLRAYSGSSACSASTNAAMPPRDGGLTAALGAVDLHDPAARQAADAQGDVEGDRTGRHDLDRCPRLVAQPHHRALAELALDLGQCRFESLLPVVRCH